MQLIQDLGGLYGAVMGFPVAGKAAEINHSVSAAMENILLAAGDRGLGGCWMTAPIETGTGDRLRDMFAPGKGSLIAMMTIGHPARIPQPPVGKDGRYTIL